MPTFKNTISTRRRMLSHVGAICSLLIAIGCESRPPATPAPVPAAPTTTIATRHELVVAAASDLKFVLGEVITAFETQSPDVKVNATFGSSGSFYAQIVNHAPFDLYLSADRSYPQKLIEQELADEKTLFQYAVGQIVLWVPKTSPLDVEARGIETLNDPSIQKIAIANPKHAPYGRAAEAALKSLGLYDQVSDRLVLGENIAQTAQFIESGAADAGLIAHSLALAPALRDKGKFWLVPQSAYPPIEQAGVILKDAKSRESAAAFRSFLLSDPSRAIFAAHGFLLPAKD